MILSPADKKTIKKALDKAEQSTSAEIRVHVDRHCKLDPMNRAVQIFQWLKMHKTKLRNGVLIYIAVEDKKMAIIGDIGINQHLTSSFWESTKTTMISHFQQDSLTKGILVGIEKVAEAVQPFFAASSVYVNELPNEVTEE